MLAHTRHILDLAESHAALGDLEMVLSDLRQLSLDDFGHLLFELPVPAFPALSGLLPSMASAEVQRNWTGTDGQTLLQQTLGFVWRVRAHYARLTHQNLEGARILDFGCGYGRIARLMYYFTDPAHFWAVDPWHESIRLCRQSRLPGNFFVSDYLPTSLPFPNVTFDLIYAFSVFTHLSRRAMHAALDTLERYLAPNGVLVITCRPEEAWHHIPIDPTCTRSRDEILAEHRRTGFAFVPHLRAPVDGDVTYGDSSFTFDWFARELPAWHLAAHDRSPDDPFQLIMFLQRRG